MSREKSQLIWRCRRGIKEMDIILMTFLNQSYPSLNTTDKMTFKQLLDEPDLDILNWVTGKTKPHNKKLMQLINLIRQSNNQH